jgi:hypothetical protein
MTMRGLLILGAALAVASATVDAASFRLAFSKVEDIEIFVDHADGAEWCSPLLKVRAVYGGKPDHGALARLLPRLGSLLDAQCPAAARIDWASTTSDGRPVARGTSTKAQQWALRTDAAPPVAAAPDKGEAAAPAPAPAPAELAQAVPAAAPAPPQAAVAPAPPVEPPPPDSARTLPPVALQTPAPRTSPAPSSPAVPPPALQPPAAPPVAPVPGPAQAAVPAEAASPAAAAPKPIPDFAVNGWKPLSAAQARAQAGFLTEIEDQNGCRILTRIDGAQDMRYLSLKSDGLDCGADGYASGKGRLVLERSDGAQLVRTGQLWFAAGLPFNQELTSARLVASDAQRTLWLHLESDADAGIHYLLRVRAANYGAIGFWQVEPRIDALTEQEARFRQADQIREAVSAGLAALDVAVPGAARAQLVFASDFDKGLVSGSADHLLYVINASRRVGRSAADRSEWQFSPQQATNYLFQRDARLAQQERMEAQRLEQQKRFEEQREAQRKRNEAIQRANLERRNLQTYQQLVAEAAQDPKRLLGRLESDLHYEPGSGGTYTPLVGGGQRQISRIVRVDGRDGEDAKVDWPYEMRLIGQRDLKDGWYRVQGNVALDPKRLDGDDLPLTLLTPADGAVTPCKDKGCEDLVNPLEVTRLTLGNPEWTPEAAESLIQSLLGR